MLEGLFMLLTLSTIMAIASFLAGSLPLTLALSQSRLRLVAAIGMGVLVGTALVVIIPEGVETLYSADDYSADSHTRRSQLFVRGSDEEQYEYLHPWEFERPQVDVKPNDDTNPLNALPGPIIPAGSDVKAGSSKHTPPKTPTVPGEVGVLAEEHHPKFPSSSSSPDPLLQTEHSYQKHEPHAWIGTSLILGFILMCIIDTLPFLAPPAPAHPQNNIYSLSDLSTSPPPPSTASPQRSLSTTLGLCIHSAAAGIALGASSTSTSSTSLSLSIFVAIMVHKASAAFGLTSVLLKQGLGKRGARAHLVIFSLAAPIGAVCTWVVVLTLGAGGSGEPALVRWWTGVLLLFSGGTFLYVAMHTMQEEDSQMIAQEESNGYLDGPNARQPRGQKDSRNTRLVLAAVGGMLLPLITQIGLVH